MGMPGWRGDQMVSAPALAGLVALLALLVLLACAVPAGIGGSGPPTARGVAPCATNTPHAALSPGGGIIAVVFLWSPPQPAGTVPASGPTSNTRATVCILREDDGALIAHYDIGATGVAVMPGGSLFAVAPDSSVLYVSSASPQTQSSRMCAVRALTGARLWCMNMVGYIEQAAVGTGALYLLENGTLEALDAVSGAVLWQQPGFDTDQLQPIVLDGDRIYEPTSDGVALFDEMCAWRTEDGTAAWCTKSYFDRSIFQFSESGGYVTLVTRLTSSLLLQELRASDGGQVWQQRLTGIEPQQTLNVGAGVYIIGTRVNQQLDYVLLALDAATGQQEWLRDDQQTPLSLFSDTRNFAAMRAGTALGYVPASTASSTPAWQTPLTQGGGVGLFVTQQAVYYGIGSYAVGALRLSDGKRLWEASHCTSGSESAPGHAADGATLWCHWAQANEGFQMATASGRVVL